MKEILSAITAVLTFAAFFPYIWSIWKGTNKPHFFSWVIWGLATFVVFLAQLADGGGIGAWPTALSALITFYVAWLSFERRSEISITRSDWIFFVLALGSIFLWYYTSNPLLAVILLTVIDTLGFGPTLRKAYEKPFEENLTLYVLMTIRNIVSIFALQNYSWTTILFPAVVALTCAILVVIVYMRRQVLPKSY